MTDKKQPDRFNVFLKIKYREKVEKIAKLYSLSHGELMETLIEQADLNVLDEHLNAKRESRVDGRTKRFENINKLDDIKDLSEEQLAVLNATIAKLKQGK